MLVFNEAIGNIWQADHLRIQLYEKSCSGETSPDRMTVTYFYRLEVLVAKKILWFTRRNWHFVRSAWSKEELADYANRYFS